LSDCVCSSFGCIRKIDGIVLSDFVKIEVREDEVDDVPNFMSYNSVHFMYYKTVYFNTEHYFYYVSFKTSNSIASLFLEVIRFSKRS